MLSFVWWKEYINEDCIKIQTKKLVINRKARRVESNFDFLKKALNFI
jgi:hypothetical protein